jgi:hypothetical protein
MLTRDCRIVPVGREFRRPIAYDVDYVYKGTKYRSRLPEDPGNRLKIRVSITPGSAPSRAPPAIPDSGTPALAPAPAACKDGGHEAHRLPARQQRSPTGVGHDLACASTGTPHSRWVTGAFCCSSEKTQPAGWVFRFRASKCI